MAMVQVPTVSQRVNEEIRKKREADNQRFDVSVSLEKFLLNRDCTVIKEKHICPNGLPDKFPLFWEILDRDEEYSKRKKRNLVDTFHTFPVIELEGLEGATFEHTQSDTTSRPLAATTSSRLNPVITQDLNDVIVVVTIEVSQMETSMLGTNGTTLDLTRMMETEGIVLELAAPQQAYLYHQ
ncbi:hypothetical protein HAX54_005374 [Datura stramonium]|uniref:Uncharacterized protein n=1 Tax=Datura stramonium TaxID=4076 RepID=A0ABS8T9Y1_DATST|nr:hypothetical protein [Datura stramonium]